MRIELGVVGSRGKPPSAARKAANPAMDGNLVPASRVPIFDIGDDVLLNAEQLAERLGVAPKTIRKWRYERYLPPECMVKLRHHVRYRLGKVLEWHIAKGDFG